MGAALSNHFFGICDESKYKFRFMWTFSVVKDEFHMRFVIIVCEFFSNTIALKIRRYPI